MEAYFKQEDKKLKLNIECRNDLERAMLEEFIQQEISGYDHSYQYEYNRKDNTLKMHFLPKINRNNLYKEGFRKQNHKYLKNFKLGFTFNYSKYFNEVELIINSFGVIYHLNHDSSLVIKKVKDIYELREYIKKNESVWRTYKFNEKI